MKSKSIYVLLFVLMVTHITAAQKHQNYPSNIEIQQTLQSIVDQGNFAGIVTVVADKNKIKSVNCLGYQNISKRIKMKPNSLFWVASQSKPIAATAVMMLVDEGKLNLDKSVDNYLPELKNLFIKIKMSEDFLEEQKETKTITLRMLLSHTSGMKWVGSVQDKAGVIDILSLKTGIYVSAVTPLDAEPGKEFRYSNQGINVAAAIVERVSGIPYEEFLRKRLFKPLEMTNTTFWPTVDQQKCLAIPYEKINGTLQAATINQLQYPLNDKCNRHAEAAGGLFSTPEDLVKFYQMIANKGVWKGKRLLSENSIVEMGIKQTNSLIDTSYGLGWFVSDDEMGHGGSYGTDTRINKKNGLITMYFTQEKGLDKENMDALKIFLEKVKQIYAGI